MIALKLTTSRFIRARNAWSPRAFVTATPTLSKSKKDKETLEACEKVKQAADAVEETAQVVKQTSEYVRETTKEVGDKAKDLVVDAAKATTEAIKDKVMKR